MFDVKSAYWERLMHMGIPAMDALRPAFLSEEKQFRTVFYGTACTYNKSGSKVNEAVQNMARLARLQNMAFMQRLEDKLKGVVMVSTDSIAVRLIALDVAPERLAEQLSEEGGTLKVEAVFSRMILSGKTNLWVGEEAGQIVTRPRKMLTQWSGAEAVLRGMFHGTFPSLESIPAEAVELRRLLESHLGVLTLEKPRRYQRLSEARRASGGFVIAEEMVTDPGRA